MSGFIPTNATIAILPRNKAVAPTANHRVQLVVPQSAMERVSGEGHQILRHLYDDSGTAYRRNDQITITGEDGFAAPDILVLYVEGIDSQPDPLGYVHCMLVATAPN